MTRLPQAAVILVKAAGAVALAAGACFGQTCNITSPASGQLFQAPAPLQLSASVSSAPTAYKLIWSVDYQRWANGYAKNPHSTINDYRDAWQGPWTVTWYTGLNGDGPHTVSGMVYDVFGNTLATCAAITFTVRIEGMSNQSVNSFPTTGKGKWGFLTFDGSNAGNIGNTNFIDGYALPYEPVCGGSGATGQSGGWQVPNFNTACFPNGPHLIYSSYFLGSINDPYLLPKTFASSNVSGNNITVASHYSVQGSVVTFASSGTLPAPLVTGCQYYWQTSGSSTGTASYSIANGVITVSTNAGCSFAAGVPVFLRNIHSNSPTNGVPLCDGYYKMATGTGTSFTVTAPPGCPNGVTNNYNFEVVVNPYFANYIDANTISVSSTPGGPTVTLTNGGSGTHTLTQRLRSPYWAHSYQGGDVASSGAPADIQQLVTFSNGSAPMEIEVPYWEMHMVAGASVESVCPKIKNTDLSLTTISCTTDGLIYTEIDDGGLSGVCSVNSSGNVTPIMPGWCQVHVQCAACAANGVSLPTVTVYIQVQSGSVTYPHFTHGGTVTNAFSPGNSFFPLSAWFLNVVNATPYNSNAGNRPLWYGPMMQEAKLNSSMIAPEATNSALGNPGTTSCFSSSWPTALHAYEASFAAQYGTYFELDTESMEWGSNASAFLAAFLNNIGYNRQSCYSGFMNQLVGEGRTWRTFSYDELNAYMAGQAPFRNPNLGSTDFPSITVSAGVATYHVTETFSGVWNQPAGTGSWIKMAGAVTNSCLNGWFPVTGITTIAGLGNPPTGTSFTAPTTCANGTYTESTTQLYHYWVSAANPGGENASTLPRLVGVSDTNIQNWNSTFFTQIVVSSCNGTTCTAEFYMPGHAIANGQAIRVQGSVNNLNVVAPVTVIDTNHFSISYRSLFGTLPSNGTYNSSNDANLYITVDGNFPPTPFLSLRNIFTSVSGNPATTWSAIGLTYYLPNPGVQNWEGKAIGEDAAWLYIPQPPAPIFGTDTSVWQIANYSQSTSGLVARAYELQPRAMLWAGDPDYAQYCPNFRFNPACDRPLQLDWRPETMVAQLIGMLTLDVSALRLYTFAGNMTDMYNLDCCGWSASGTGVNKGINPFISPQQWSAMARTNALIKLREDTELQPPANKPYMGPMFLTDAHSSSTYGNQLTILCASEMPYGVQTVTLPQISGGSMLKYILTGYSLSVKVLSGNPSADTDEFCSVPGRTTTYVALPASPAVNPMDNLTFSPPNPRPFGASKFLVQVGYYPRAMQDDPVIDCTSACTIQVDHHNTAAWYRVIYADSNNLPLSIGDPIQIPSQGLN